ncbi:DUF29 domain-containing protein [Kamptonema sp. UHCC 0994]|uniref:DUF29 domain-containing protein n=1 Tax=Kamptonema sp. UHCC 0994 TaxID=3031329 RepID=UPI0023B9F919|nr:DUF29 domain-containing protein [Kamptonema sp. UHCC 0994]MDF0553300.1 DUF29 domain-containing protein [Kamptonema sp. UHCC 0994]
MKTTLTTLTSSLHDQDFNLWVESTIELLQQKRFDQLDIENLISEIESMGKNDRKSVKSNLRILLMHLLKWQYQPDKRTNSWRTTIKEHRNRLEDDFADSPSLKNYFLEVFDECYQKARDLASSETGLSISVFPVECPFHPDLVLESDFLPA